MRKFWRHCGPGLMLAAGIAAITVGAGMIFLPAGLIVGGSLSIVWWVLDSLDGRGDEG